jgi:sec-independent protein translocase protein TatC
VILGIFVIAAFLTPPDALSQTAMALPMWLLYEIGIILSRILLR